MTIDGIPSQIPPSQHLQGEALARHGSPERQRRSPHASKATRDQPNGRAPVLEATPQAIAGLHWHGRNGRFAVNSDLVGAVFAFDGADGNCGSSDLCFWDHNDGQGGIGDTVWADDWYINNGFWGQGSSADNRTDSYKNSWNTKSVTMYEHKYYNDGNPGWTNCRVANHNLLLNYTAANDNEQSSHKNATGTGFC